MKPDTSTRWDLPAFETPKDDGDGRSAQEFLTQQQLVSKVAAIGQKNDWSKSEVARRIGMPEGTFSQWFSGKYKGRMDTHNTKVAKWVGSFNDMSRMAAAIPTSPDFIETTTSNELTNLLQAAQIVPTMVIGTCGPGMGKTFTAKQYLATHPNSWLVDTHPKNRTHKSILFHIARQLNLSGYKTDDVFYVIGDKLRGRESPSLLIVDETQNLTDDAVNQLRHLVDNYYCGVALLGNTETYGRFASDWSTKTKYGQLSSRILKRVIQTRPVKKDLHAFIAAWGIDDQKQVDFLTAVGMKPGAFRSVDMTIKLARITAGSNELTLQHLEKAWSSRDVEVI